MTTTAYARRPGWLTFATVVLFTVAFVRIISAINYFGSSLSSSVSNLAGSTSQGELQSNASAVQSAWGNVKSSAQHLSGINMNALNGAWNDFSQAVQNVPQSASVSAAEQSISQSAQGLQSAVQSSIDSYDCSGSSSS